jgi:hypothetical protein
MYADLYMLRWAALGAVCLATSSASAAGVPSPRDLEFFEKRVRPVLIEHCYECHSEQAKQLRGGLRLDLSETTLRGGDSGPAIVAGLPDKSLVVEAIRYESLEMPPKGKLPERAIADLIKWIEMGAPDPRLGGPPESTEVSRGDAREHWAFRPVQTASRPQVIDTEWPLTEADSFVLSRLEKSQMTPARDADRFTWLRRVSFDLTGLPPTIEEIDSFQSDPSPLAHASVVDRLLASRAFGERWARHWLDLVGYADQIGTSNDIFAEHAWRYRDYVVHGLNSDLPFDDFIRQQVAGDLLPYDTVEQRAANLTATGFLLLGDLEIVEADKAKLAVDVVDQQVVKVTNAFLGMTVGCARCHDHKFDPIPQRDYYALAGFFHSTDSYYKTDRGVWSDVNAVALPETSEQQKQRALLTGLHHERVKKLKSERAEVASRKAALDRSRNGASESTREEAGADASQDEQSTKNKQLAGQLAKRLTELDRTIEHAEFFAPAVARTYAVKDVDQPKNMRITIRGNPRALGDEVPRGFLQVALQAASVPPDPIPAAESGRRQLADWLASADNPLTARVTVNRIWQKLFGVGIVKSVDYFGVRGDVPSHPELLDHLADKFVQGGWSRKQFIRSLVLSRAYRMSSDHVEHWHTIDPDNRLLWRMNRRRLDAEALRDALLAVSGELCPSSGGPALPLEFPENLANLDPKNVNPPSFKLAKWRENHPFQRTLYLPIIRSGPQPGPAEIRNVFDFTQPAEFSGQRPTTAVPTQALYLMNSPDVKKHAENLARLVESQSNELTNPVENLWLRVFNRPITSEERREAIAFVSRDGWVELCRAVLAANEFLVQL